MRTTIEIADSILLRATVRARERRITLRSLIEESLAATLDRPEPAVEIKPVTFKGKGLSREFADASWDQIRDAIYRRSLSGEEAVVRRSGLFIIPETGRREPFGPAGESVIIAGKPSCGGGAAVA